MGTFHVPPRETSPAAKSEEKQMFSQANEICVAITLFKVHFITWLGEIDIGYFLTRAHARESHSNAPQLSQL